MKAGELNVAIVGLGFGTQFIPIYKRYPGVNMYAICRRSRAALDAVGEAFGVETRYERFEDVLADPLVDFVHINSPLTDHGWMSIAALESGKHVLCTVPMALKIDECRQIVELVRKTGLKYMMAETVLYSREYLYAKELYASGQLGRVQFLQGSHHQDMDGWPDGWPGLPPMFYATHCISPCLSLVAGEAESVSCFGSGRIAEPLIARWGSPFAVESAHIALRGCLPIAVRHGAAISRELRRLRFEDVDRVAPGGGRGARAARRQTAAAANGAARLRAGLRASASRADPSLHDEDVPRSAGICASRAREGRRSRRHPLSPRDRPRI